MFYCIRVIAILKKSDNISQLPIILHLLPYFTKTIVLYFTKPPCCTWHSQFCHLRVSSEETRKSTRVEARELELLSLLRWETPVRPVMFGRELKQKTDLGSSMEERGKMQTCSGLAFYDGWTVLLFPCPQFGLRSALHNGRTARTSSLAVSVSTEHF